MAVIWKLLEITWNIKFQSIPKRIQYMFQVSSQQWQWFLRYAAFITNHIQADRRKTKLSRVYMKLFASFDEFYQILHLCQTLAGHPVYFEISTSLNKLLHSSKQLVIYVCLFYIYIKQFLKQHNMFCYNNRIK